MYLDTAQPSSASLNTVRQVVRADKNDKKHLKEDKVSDPFLGEIKMWAFNWAPRGWALCDGKELPVAQNRALFALLGDSFGGDARTTFNLPDLRGRTPMGIGIAPDVPSPNYQRGQKVGSESVTLTADNMPSHQHLVTAHVENGTAAFPIDGFPATAVPSQATTTQKFNIYTPVNAGSPIPEAKHLAAESVSTTGASTPLDNMQPFAVVNFCIATAGIFPPRE